MTDKEREEVEDMYQWARPGDHLMTPYQCELCHFRNVFHRDPDVEAQEDKWVLLCIVRANLDAFWSRRASTVSNNLQDMKRVIRIDNAMGIDNPMESFKRGPFPVKDTFGMVLAIILLQQLLDRGKNARTIQWDTMQGVHSAMSNFMHTTPGGVGGFVMSDGKRSPHITHSMTNTMWFKCFMDGSHERMGDIKIQDTALTIDVLLALQALLDESWTEAKNNGENELLFEISLLGCALVDGFSAALQGEEFGHLRLNETILLTTQGLQHPRKPHIVVGLEGHFKGQVSRNKHKIPLVPTSNSGIANQTWLFHLLECYEGSNTTHGPLFWNRTRDQTPITI
ncbi:hypothetical protein ACA910_002141 [Epithemia clementina (nom. ined.)]